MIVSIFAIILVAITAVYLAFALLPGWLVLLWAILILVLLPDLVVAFVRGFTARRYGVLNSGFAQVLKAS